MTTAVVRITSSRQFDNFNEANAHVDHVGSYITLNFLGMKMRTYLKLRNNFGHIL